MNKIFISGFVSAFIIINALSVLFAQENSRVSNSRKGEPIQLVHADSGMGLTKDGKQVKICQGNVRIVQGNVTVTSNKAVQYIDENRADFSGNVVVTQEDMTLESPAISYYGATGLALSNSGISVRDKKGRLKADSGSYSTQTQIADFMGKVKVSDDSVTIYTDMVQYHRKTRISYAYGNVKIEEDSVFIYCDTAEHHRNTRMSYAFGNVLIVDDSVLISADRIENNRNARESFALGNVLVKARFSDVLLFADTIVNKTYLSYTLAIGDPLLYQIDTIRKKALPDSLSKDSVNYAQTIEFDTMSIASDTMEVYRDMNERYIFTDSVQMIRNEASAKCGYAVYYKSGEYIELDRKPVVWYDSTQLFGDSIVVRIPSKKLEEIHSFSNSFAASKEDSAATNRIDQILGKEIIISIKNDTIRNIFAYGDSKSLYYVYSDGEPDGAKRDGSDSIIINFKKGDIDEIIWLGGIEGEFFPENIIYPKPESYYLPTFRWDSNTPRKRILSEKRRKNEKKLQNCETK